MKENEEKDSFSISSSIFMEQPEEESIYVSSESEEPKLLKKKRIKKKNFTNIRVTQIGKYSHFIFDVGDAEKYFSKVYNKNGLKPTESDVKFLEDIITSIKIQKLELGEDNLININEEWISKIKNFFKVEQEKDERVDFIKTFMENTKNPSDISCIKIAEKYKETTGKSLSKSTVHNILKDKLGYKYLKSTIKNAKINNRDNTLHSFLIIKAFIKAFKAGKEIIYIDESGIQNSNNNFYAWRQPEDTIYFKLGTKKRLNLIMAVSKNKVIHYKISEENTCADNFLEFIAELEEKIKESNIQYSFFLMDNLSSHKTNKVYNYFVKKKISVLYNTPYLSSFNAIELAFRNLKQKIRGKLFESIQEVSEFTENAIKELNNGNTLLLNFRETLMHYKRFLDDHLSINLNRF